MEYEVVELEGRKRKLKIKIPETVMSSRVEQAYKDVNKQIRMPGFRPGKIPKNILEKQVPIQSFTSLFQELMQEYYEKALKESGITPAGEPDIDHSELKELKKDAAFSFTVLLDVKEDVQLKPYMGLKFKRKLYKATDREVDGAIAKILEPLGELEPFEDDHAAQMGDVVLLDFEGFQRNGERLENGDARDYSVRIGQKKMIEGFEGQLIGHKKGEEFEVKVALPTDWNNKMKRVSMPIPGSEEDEEVDVGLFNVRMKDIKKLVLPELTDELVKRKEIGMDSVEKFRLAVKSDLQAFKEQQEEVRIKEEIFNQLIKDNDLSPPESAIKRELKFMVEGVKYQMQKSGMKWEDSGFDEDRAKKEWGEKAEFNAKGYSILEAVADEEKIQVSQSDMDQEYQRLADETKQTLEQIQARVTNNRESMAHTTSKIRGQKALNLIYANCEFEFIEETEKESEASESGKAS